MGMWFCPSCNYRIYIPPGTYTQKCPACERTFDLPQATGSRESVEKLVMTATYALESGRWADVRSFCMSILNLDRGNPDAYYLAFMARVQKKDLRELERSRILFLSKKEYQDFVEYGDPDRVERVRKIGNRNLEIERKHLIYFRYNTAKNKCEKATSARKFREAAELFGKIYEFRDSAGMRQYCIQRAEQIESGFGIKLLQWILPYGAIRRP